MTVAHCVVQVFAISQKFDDVQALVVRLNFTHKKCLGLVKLRVRVGLVRLISHKHKLRMSLLQV